MHRETNFISTNALRCCEHYNLTYQNKINPPSSFPKRVAPNGSPPKIPLSFTRWPFPVNRGSPGPSSCQWKLENVETKWNFWPQILGASRNPWYIPTDFPYMDVSENKGIPKSSILIGISFINHPFWGTTIFGNSQIPTVDGNLKSGIINSPVEGKVVEISIFLK